RTTDRATWTVVSPGLHTLVVDHGRPRSRSLGVPVGGAADRFALAIGNGLVGNQPEAAVLEVSLAGPTLVADAALACVLWGAPFELGTDQRELTGGKGLSRERGEGLCDRAKASGKRGNHCVGGGLG